MHVGPLGCQSRRTPALLAGSQAARPVSLGPLPFFAASAARNDGGKFYDRFTCLITAPTLEARCI